jgi:hypothetical protein
MISSLNFSVDFEVSSKVRAGYHAHTLLCAVLMFTNKKKIQFKFQIFGLCTFLGQCVCMAKVEIYFLVCVY